MKHFIFLILFFVSLSISVAIKANSEISPDVPIELGEQVYKKATLENIITYFVKSGYIDLRVPETMDDYARIFQCEVYQDYYTDEHEWQKVSEAIMKSAMHDVDESLNRSERRKGHFYFTSNLRLERYDQTSKGFPLIEEDIMFQIQRFNFLDLSGLTLCEKVGVGKEFPAKVYLQTDHPISLETVTVPDDSIFEEISDIQVSSNRYQTRNITAVFFFSVNNFEGNNSPECGNVECVDLLGKLEYIGYYKDPEFKEFLFLQKIEPKKPEEDAY